MTLSIGTTYLPGLLQVRGLIPRGTRINVFRSIFDVFLILGTLVGVVVVTYMLYNAYKYRERGDGMSAGEGKAERPVLGELPTGGGGGRKLFLSFGLSAVIVVSLIGWTYGTLLFVEQTPTVDDEAPEDGLAVTVEGYQFGWEFQYPNGYVAQNTLRVPVDAEIRLRVTSRDVFHNFGVPELRVKSDAIPGQETETWFIADETGTYTARCYELCGSGHSHMVAEVIVMPKDEFREWYRNQSTESDASVDRPAPAGSLGPTAGVTGA